MIAFWVFVKIAHGVIEIYEYIYAYMLFYFGDIYIYIHALFNKCLPF